MRRSAVRIRPPAPHLNPLESIYSQRNSHLLTSNRRPITNRFEPSQRRAQWSEAELIRPPAPYLNALEIIYSQRNSHLLNSNRRPITNRFEPSQSAGVGGLAVCAQRKKRARNAAARRVSDDLVKDRVVDRSEKSVGFPAMRAEKYQTQLHDEVFRHFLLGLGVALG